MDLKELGKRLISIGAPAIGTALGGPVGGIAARAAVTLLESKFGGTIPLEEGKSRADSLADFFTSPENQIELQKLEHAHEEKLRELMLQERQMEFADTASARAREVAITQATGGRDINLYVLAWVVIGGFFGISGIAALHQLPDTQLMGIIIGGLVSGFSLVLGYFFGSSRGSREKDKMMALNHRR